MDPDECSSVPVDANAGRPRLRAPRFAAAPVDLLHQWRADLLLARQASLGFHEGALRAQRGRGDEQGNRGAAEEDGDDTDGPQMRLQQSGS